MSIQIEEGILITPFDPDDAEALKVYREGAKRYRDAMGELAQ